MKQSKDVGSQRSGTPCLLMGGSPDLGLKPTLAVSTGCDFMKALSWWLILGSPWSTTMRIRRLACSATPRKTSFGPTSKYRCNGKWHSCYWNSITTKKKIKQCHLVYSTHLSPEAKNHATYPWKSQGSLCDPAKGRSHVSYLIDKGRWSAKLNY